MRSAALASLIAAASIGLGGGAEVVPREYPGANSAPLNRPRTRSGNNRPAGLTFAQKKRRRKIARASRRYNLRNGA